MNTILEDNGGIEEFTELAGSGVGTGSGDYDRPRVAKAGLREVAPAHLPQPSDYSQWACLPNDAYMAVGRTDPRLSPAAYKLGLDGHGNILFQRMDVMGDTLMRLPDSASDRVLEGITDFWESKPRFERHGQLFKRGILLWGPPGSGKTATVMLLMRNLIERGGMVIMGQQEPELTANALAVLRRIEPDRPLICILEDIDELCERYSEHALLGLLDGENQVGNIVHVATTNYPERLDARLVNRPSRFDEVIKIGMPSMAARRAYLRAKMDADEYDDAELERWVGDTDGLSIAHLRELAVAVHCLGRPYLETVGRLKGMARRPKGTSGGQYGLWHGPNGKMHEQAEKGCE